MARRFTILIGLAAAGVMTLGAQTGAATPEVDSYETKISLTHECCAHVWEPGTTRGFLWHGFLWSAARKCEVGRRVILFKRRPGPDRKLGETQSVPDGRNAGWGIVTPRKPDRVYAKVTPEVGDGFACRADYSPLHRH